MLNQFLSFFSSNFLCACCTFHVNHLRWPPETLGLLLAILNSSNKITTLSITGWLESGTCPWSRGGGMCSRSKDRSQAHSWGQKAIVSSSQAAQTEGGKAGSWKENQMILPEERCRTGKNNKCLPYSQMQDTVV